jgi:hypothetical protein
MPVAPLAIRQSSSGLFLEGLAMLLDLWWLVVLAYLALPVIALARLSGGARAAAAAPLVVMIPVAVITAIGLAQASNLWPLLLLLASPLALAYLGVVFLFARKPSSPAGP